MELTNFYLVYYVYFDGYFLDVVRYYYYSVLQFSLQSHFFKIFSFTAFRSQTNDPLSLVNTYMDSVTHSSSLG